MADVFAGHILLEDHEIDGWIQVEGGRIVDWEEGDDHPERPIATGWICPRPVNAHTHVADTFLRDVPGKPTSVRELVGPGGWKHRRLARADPDAQKEGVLRYADEMARSGTSHFLDFREGGMTGAAWLRDQTPDLPVAPHILGRPETNTFDEDEAYDLLPAVDGIGLSGMRDFADPGDLEAWAEEAHKARKPFAVHVSEDARDDLDAVLALDPAFVVHMVQGSRNDLNGLAEEEVPVVVCPRSNRAFGYKTPVAAMVDAGCTLAVGTDNGMLQDGDLLAELALLKAYDPRLGTADLLRILTHHGRALLDLPPVLPPRRGQPLELVVLPEDPLRMGARKPKLSFVAPTQEGKESE